MKKSKSELKKTIYLEKSIYQQYMFQTCVRRIFACIKREPTWLILKWQILSRTVDYYNYRLKHSPSIIEKVKYLYYIRKRNILGARLGLEIGTENIAPGLLVYHYAGGCVVNGGSIIGKNCHLHGNNCIGNAGPHDLHCPVIGDNVMIGVGAKIIGNVNIADGIKIAAGAVVVHSFDESNITIAGVPAKKVK